MELYKNMEASIKITWLEKEMWSRACVHTWDKTAEGKQSWESLVTGQQRDLERSEARVALSEALSKSFPAFFKGKKKE